jgi:hypothetical protein
VSALRIPCFFKPGTLEAAYVAAVFESETLRTYASVEFLVDTGATRTTISDRDAIRLGIDYGMLEKHAEGMLGIGGTVETYTLKNAKLLFHKKDKKTHTETLETICFLRHAQLNEKILRIPSILGRDILNKYALVYDKRQEKAYITDEQTPR